MNRTDALASAVKKAVGGPGGSEVSVYVFDEKRKVFTKGHGEPEYYIPGTAETIPEDSMGSQDGPATVVARVNRSTVCEEDRVVGLYASRRDYHAVFLVRDDRILSIDMFGDCSAASGLVERFVLAFSEAMGGLSRFEKRK